MEPAEYNRLSRFETWYWWYLAQRENLLAVVRSLNPGPGVRVLDAGCGTGVNLGAVTAAMPIRGFGVDLSPFAAAHWDVEIRRTGCIASVNALPYEDGSFDLVYSVDVLGCRGVRLEVVLAEFRRVLAPRGGMVLLLPAFQWLRSAHDEAVHSWRRFTVGELTRAIATAGFRVLKTGYRFSLLFPLIAAVRLARKVRMGQGTPESDLTPVPAWVNAALLTLSRLDRRLTEHVPLPFGSTVLLVARKERT